MYKKQVIIGNENSQRPGKKTKNLKQFKNSRFCHF